MNTGLHEGAIHLLAAKWDLTSGLASELTRDVHHGRNPDPIRPVRIHGRNDHSRKIRQISANFMHLNFKISRVSGLKGKDEF